jgi:hypothetical protein
MEGLSNRAIVLRQWFGGSPGTQPPQKAESKMPILRRGLSPEYYFYVKIFARQNGLDFLIDRRVADRRRGAGHVSQNRRSTDRRGPLPSTWNQADIVLPQSDTPEPKTPTKPQLIAVPPQRW